MIISLVLVFFIVKAMPGDPVETLTQQYMTTDKLPYEQAYERAKIALNYDPEVPVMQQFVNYIGQLLHGDMGQSMSYKDSVVNIVLGALPWTLLVCSISLLLSFIVGNIVGLFIAWKRSKVWDGVSGCLRFHTGLYRGLSAGGVLFDRTGYLPGARCV